MFTNKLPLNKISKFCKYVFESRSDCPCHYLRTRSITRGIYSEISVVKPVENNGFRNGFPLCRNPTGILTIVRTVSKFLDKKCWNCKRDLEVKDFACAACNALQYPQPNVNFFQLVGMSQMYDIDLEELSRKFKNLQMIFHPDKFVNKSKEELEISESYSRLLNKAYTTLKDPLTRGLYLLELQKVDTDTNQLQQDFLVAIMEKNEQLESIDKASTLDTFKQKNSEDIENQIQLITTAFRANQVESAKINLLKLNYFINLDNKIKEKQTKFSLPPDA